MSGCENGPGHFGLEEQREELNVTEERTATRQNQFQEVVGWMQGGVAEDEDMQAEIVCAGMQALVEAEPNE